MELWKKRLDLKTLPSETVVFIINHSILCIRMNQNNMRKSQLCFLYYRWRMSLTDIYQQIRLWQVIFPQERAAETGQRPRHGGLRQQWRQHVASVQVQEQLTESLSERHPAAHDGSEGRWRHRGPQEEEPLGVLQLQRMRSGRRLPGVVLRNRGQLCLPHGWETSAFVTVQDNISHESSKMIGGLCFNTKSALRL